MVCPARTCPAAAGEPAAGRSSSQAPVPGAGAGAALRAGAAGPSGGAPNCPKLPRSRLKSVTSTAQSPVKSARPS